MLGESRPVEAVKRIKIRGVVQGVGYRWSMAGEARRLGIRGWVRNRLDGSVEAVLQGSPEAIDAMLEWARKGPSAAVVAAVDVYPGDGNFNSFDQWPTA